MATSRGLGPPVPAPRWGHREEPCGLWDPALLCRPVPTPTLGHAPGHLRGLLVLTEPCPPEPQRPGQGQSLAGLLEGALAWLLGWPLGLGHCPQGCGGSRG